MFESGRPKFTLIYINLHQFTLKTLIYNNLLKNHQIDEKSTKKPPDRRKINEKTTRSTKHQRKNHQSDEKSTRKHQFDEKSTKKPPGR